MIIFWRMGAVPGGDNPSPKMSIPLFQLSDPSPETPPAVWRWAFGKTVDAVSSNHQTAGLVLALLNVPVAGGGVAGPHP